jgi:hypothetical protein
MAVNILCRDLAHLNPAPSELKSIDLSYDVHVKRVFARSGLAKSDSRPHVLDAARELDPDYPGKLDLGAWHGPHLVQTFESRLPQLSTSRRMSEVHLACSDTI